MLSNNLPDATTLFHSHTLATANMIIFKVSTPWEPRGRPQCPPWQMDGNLWLTPHFTGHYQRRRDHLGLVRPEGG